MSPWENWNMTDPRSGERTHFGPLAVTEVGVMTDRGVRVPDDRALRLAHPSRAWPRALGAPC